MLFIPRGRQFDIRQLRAITERSVADGYDAVGQRDGRQFRAIAKSARRYVLKAFRGGYDYDGTPAERAAAYAYDRDTVDLRRYMYDGRRFQIPGDLNAAIYGIIGICIRRFIIGAD